MWGRRGAWKNVQASPNSSGRKGAWYRVAAAVNQVLHGRSGTTAGMGGTSGGTWGGAGLCV